MLVKKQILTLGLSLLSLLPLTIVSAGIITETQSFTINNANGASNALGNPTLSSFPRTRSNRLLFSGFDASLGTLDSVTLAFNSQWSHLATGSARDTSSEIRFIQQVPCGSGGRTCPRNFYGNQTQVNGNAISDFDISIAGLSGLNSSSRDENAIACSDQLNFFGVAECEKTVNDIDNILDGLLIASTSELDDFLNPNPVNIFVSNTLRVSANCDSFDAAWNRPNQAGIDSCSLNNSVVWNGLLTLTYNFTEATTPSVPEPGVLSLLAIGFAGIGFSRRRLLRD